MARDVTAAQDAYNALRDSEENFRAATEFAPNGVILAAIDGKILEMNKAAKRFLSLTKDCGERRLDRLFDEQNWHALQAILTDLLGEKKKVANYTVAQSGEYNWLQLSISLVWDNDQQPKYYVMHIQNITSLLLAKQEAERATLAKAALLPILVMKFAPPLTLFWDWRDMIQSDSLSKLQQQKLTQLSGAATELLTMLNSILEFAKVESHQGTIVHETFQTSQALNAIAVTDQTLVFTKRLNLCNDGGP